MAVGTVSGIDPSDNWQLVASQAMNGLSTYTFSSLSGYKTYWMVGKGLTSGGTAEIVSVRPNADTSAASYASTWAANNNSGQFLVSPEVTSSRAFSFEINNADKSAPHTVKTNTYSTNAYQTNQGDAYIDPTPITSILVKSYYGTNFTGGTVYLFGIPA